MSKSCQAIYSSFRHQYLRNRCATSGELLVNSQYGIHLGISLLHDAGNVDRGLLHEYRTADQNDQATLQYIRYASQAFQGPTENPKLALPVLLLSTMRSPCGPSFLNRYLLLVRLHLSVLRQYFGQSIDHIFPVLIQHGSIRRLLLGKHGLCRLDPE